LTNLKRGVPTFKEELFGPVASFYKVENEQAAIDLANDSPLAGGSIFTKHKTGKWLTKSIAV
jgi:succinate-semialdehyde dehydrogenase/glutarate-semialdehyde dehydrogenase